MAPPTTSFEEFTFDSYVWMHDGVSFEYAPQEQ